MEIIKAKAGCVYIIGQLHRPGCMTFALELEHKHFSPDDEEQNGNFNMFMTKYGDDDVLFYIIEIPGSTPITKCEQIATQCNLKLVNGKPFDGHSEFPADCAANACFTLETVNHNIQSSLKDEFQDNLAKWGEN